MLQGKGGQVMIPKRTWFIGRLKPNLEFALTSFSGFVVVRCCREVRDNVRYEGKVLPNLEKDDHDVFDLILRFVARSRTSTI